MYGKMLPFAWGNSQRQRAILDRIARMPCRSIDCYWYCFRHKSHKQGQVGQDLHNFGQDLQKIGRDLQKAERLPNRREPVDPLKLERFCAPQNVHRKSGNILKLERSCVLGHIAALLAYPGPRIGGLLKLERFCVLGHIATFLAYPGPRIGDPLKLERFCAPKNVRQRSGNIWKLERPWAATVSSDDIQMSPLSSLCPQQTQCQHPHSISAFQAQTQYS